VNTVEGGLDLELVACPICGSYEAEPVAVGNDFACGSSRDTYLTVCCSICGLLYLNPRPVPSAATALYPEPYFAAAMPGLGRARGPVTAEARRLIDRGRSLLSSGRVLLVSYGPELPLDTLRRAGHWSVEVLTAHEQFARAAREVGLPAQVGRRAPPAPVEAYDLVLLLYSLEHCEFPAAELRSIGRLLKPGGHALLATPNAGSTAWRLFRGRHWGGYDFPRHRCLFTRQVLQRLAKDAGLVIERAETLGNAETWLRSVACLLKDWGAPAWLQGPPARGSLIWRALGNLAETLAQARGRGSLLEVVLSKPLEPAR
jgi:SAM-dependent methyltransferase